MSAIAPFITRLYVLNFEAGMPKSKNYAPRPGGGIGASLSHRRQSLLSFSIGYVGRFTQDGLLSNATG
jgi:hypothetical protein